MMMAGLDGIQNRIDPGDPLDKDIYALSPEELKEVPHMPGSLDEALGALERDHEFLLRGDVFTARHHRDLARLQARARGRRGAAPPGPVRVLPLLRRLIAPTSEGSAGAGAQENCAVPLAVRSLHRSPSCSAGAGDAESKRRGIAKSTVLCAHGGDEVGYRPLAPRTFASCWSAPHRGTARPWLGLSSGPAPVGAA